MKHCTYLISLLLLTLTLSSQAEEKKKLYRWVDEQGNIHFSDEPHPGAKELSMPEAPAVKMTMPKLINNDLEEQQSQANEAANQAKQIYQELKLLSPENDGVIRNNGGVIELQAIIKPELKKEHTVRFFLDGKPISADAELKAVIENMEYGEHNASVIVVDQKGKQLQSSETIKFSLLHVLNPQKRQNKSN